MLRLLELYASYQGEGPNTGKPTVFVRFAGCNLKCPLWPCDTQHAIDPKLFKDKQEMIAGEDLAERILSYYAHINNICITGGEPFLQSKPHMIMLINRLKEYKFNVEVFTNGQLEWPSLACDLVDNFVMDWKLPGSGESQGLIAPTWQNVERKNLKTLGNKDAIKFTIKTEEDYRFAKARYRDYINLRPNAPMVYAGVVWGGDFTTERLCQRMLDDRLPWNLNVQVHKFIWDPERQGV